jgi:outer membrane lipoprotein LolB
MEHSARFRILAFAAALSWLVGCAPTGIQPGVDDQRRWQLSGRIGLRGDNFAESASIHWRQCGPHFDIRLSGPLGQTVARVEGRGDLLSVWINGEAPVVTRNPEALLLQRLGWSIPVRALRYWVRGETAPGSAASVTGDSRAPQALEQLGWRVDYLAYHSSSELALPARLRLRDPHLTATLIIRDWLLSDAVSGCPA